MDFPFSALPPPEEDAERRAFIKLDPPSFHIRHPPPPNELDDFITPDHKLFQTIHMGGAEVDVNRWQLVVTGLVDRPYAISLQQLKSLPSKTITAFMECYGSPLAPPTKALRRVGCLRWTGVPLKTLLDHAGLKEGAQFVWSQGLDRGKFAGVEADRYQKDLPLEKALEPDTLVAYAMNDEQLDRNRGAPVRLIVPGWFGTNSTKWLCRLEVREKRADGPFTTRFYKEHYPPDDPECESRPIWKVQPNSCIVRPEPDARVEGPEVRVVGWAWSEDEVVGVGVSADEGRTWIDADVEGRTEYSWQKLRATLRLPKGNHVVLAQAKGRDGRMQPLGEGRNHVHRVNIEVV